MTVILQLSRDRMHPYLGIASWWSAHSCFLDFELDHVTYPNHWVVSAWFSLSLILMPFSIRRNCLTQLVPNSRKIKISQPGSSPDKLDMHESE